MLPMPSSAVARGSALPRLHPSDNVPGKRDVRQESALKQVDSEGDAMTTDQLPPATFPGILAGVVCCTGRACGRIYADTEPRCPGCYAENPVSSEEPFPHPDAVEANP